MKQNSKLHVFTVLAFIAIFFISCNSQKGKTLDESLYETLATEHVPGVESYHLLYKGKDLSEESLKEFIQLFRAHKTAGTANISLYDDASVGTLTTKFPLTPEEYLFMADHFIAVSGFSEPDALLMYPFQDANYKQLGGTNWKKEPVE